MTVAEIILLAIKASIVAMVFALGLRSKPSDVPALLRRPGLLARALLSMNVVMPLVAIAAVRVFDLREDVAVTLIAISLSPIPPLLPRKETSGGGDRSFAVGLLVVFAVLAVAWIPLAVPLIGNLFGREVGVPPLPIARIVIGLVLLPLVLGIALRRFAPALALRIEPPIPLAANATLLIAAVLIIFSARHEIAAQVGDGTIVLLAAFVLIGLAVGHLLGGPEPGERMDLALTTACRHPGIALASAQLAFPDALEPKAVLIIYLLVNITIGMIYIRWRRAAVRGTSPG
ncbi:MAG TPA: bile acid:sodium symporter [Croceibacterium sp.]